MLPVYQDAYGQAMLDHLLGDVGDVSVERDDGYLEGDVGMDVYFSSANDWSAHTRKAMKLVQGRVLDIGCGLGGWRDAMRRHCPDAVYTGVDASPELCRRYGWRQGTVSGFRSRSSFDLVVCRSVLQYLPADEVRRGVENLACLCRGAAYIELVSREDWERNCDRTATDGAIYRRSAAWYRRTVGRCFTNCGGGVFLPKDSDVVLYELEKL